MNKQGVCMEMGETKQNKNKQLQKKKKDERKIPGETYRR